MKKAVKIIIIALFSCIPIISSQTVTPHLARLNTLTFRRVSPPSKDKLITHIHHLVRDIYRYNTVPDRTPLHINDEYFVVYRNLELLPTDRLVFIFSRGYAKTTEPGTNDDFIQRGACAKAAYLQLKDGLVPPHYPVVSFDYDDDRYGFAFGQAQEIEQLETVYRAVHVSCPEAKIVLIGDCRGGKVALELAARKPKNLTALILMAPFISGKELTDNIARNHLSYIPFGPTVLSRFFKYYFKNYDPKKDDLITRIPLIEAQLPILIAHRTNDQLVSTETILQLASSLRSSGNTKVETCITRDQSKPHSQLTGVADVQTAVHSFLERHVFNNVP